MKKIISLLLFVFCLSCKDKDQTYSQDVTQKEPLSEKIVTVTDSTLKQKTTEAIALLKKYSSESKVIPNDLSSMIIGFSRTVFGLINQSNGVVEVAVEEATQEHDLVILFDNASLVYSGNVIQTMSTDNDRMFIRIMSDLVKTKSVLSIASNLLRELVRPQGELTAYMRQFYFLVYVYGGVDKELESSVAGNKIEIKVLADDTSEFNSCFNKVRELKGN